MKRICSLLGIVAVAFFCSAVSAGEEGKTEAKEVVEAASPCCGHHGFLHKLFHRGCCNKVSIEIPLPSLPALPSIGCSPCAPAPCMNPLAYLMDRIRAARPCCAKEVAAPCGGCGLGLGGHLASLRCKLHALLPSVSCSRCAGTVIEEKVEPKPAPAPAPAPAPEAEKADSARRDGLLILTPAG